MERTVEPELMEKVDQVNSYAKADFSQEENNLMNQDVVLIINCFNSERFLKETIDNLLKQTYKNFQLKVVDDCSTDATYEIASSLCKSYDNFKIFRNSRRLGALNNIYNLLSLKIKEQTKTINILLDGDEYLYSGDVLNILNEKYIKTNCLIYTRKIFMIFRKLLGKSLLIKS